jgi:hypothetical protein
MEISRNLVLHILKYLLTFPQFYFPFIIKYRDPNNSKQYVDVDINWDTYEFILKTTSLTDFILIENLQDLDANTIGLLSKGFIDKILYNQLQISL